MAPIDIPTIERQARALRAQEIQRLQGLFAERLSLYMVLLGTSLLSGLEVLADVLRPVFSWNPQDGSAKPHRSVLAKLNRGVRALFSWNPQSRHHC
ncbi:hypothetical protein [Dechloromonas sp. A34]|uniref:hypothetical protein n=1 Tax=Dechloromonas sp. A34 TaxID=447588 RepID=UPI002248C99C|nr:hypothetical protein [Dechloromonas sp. A34]